MLRLVLIRRSPRGLGRPMFLYRGLIFLWGGFRKGFSLDLDLKLRLLSLIQTKSVVLDLADFTKQQNLSFGPQSLPGNGLNFCKQRLKYGCHKFLSTSQFEIVVNKV